MYKDLDKEFILKVSSTGKLLGSVRFPTVAVLAKPELSLPIMWDFDPAKVIGSGKITQVGQLIMFNGKLSDFGKEMLEGQYDKLTWSTGGILLSETRFQIKSVSLRAL